MKCPEQQRCTTTVFRLVWVGLFALAMFAAQLAPAQTFSVIHTFTGAGDGGIPGPALLMDRAGNFYGTTQYGGRANQGVVWKLVHRGSGWVVQQLYTFSGEEGSQPNDLVMGPDGNLYGTNQHGGDGFGTVFELTPPATVCKSISCPWSATVLYRFTGQSDGSQPIGLVVDQSGNLYGTTLYGGDQHSPCLGDCGVVFELSRSSGGWTESVLHAFTDGDDGGYPQSKPALDAAGNLYGTTEGGGNSGDCYLGCGVVYELSPSGSGWNETTLYNFRIQPDSNYPGGGVIFDSLGNLYSTAVDGGDSGWGTVFSLSPSNGGWTENILYSFTGAYGDEYPFRGSLLMDSAGNLWGTTPGRNGDPPYGNVFELSPSGGGWTYNSLYSFADGPDGAAPQGTLVMDSSGNLYGTAPYGGAFRNSCSLGCGTVWEITP